MISNYYLAPFASCHPNTGRSEERKIHDDQNDVQRFFVIRIDSGSLE